MINNSTSIKKDNSIMNNTPKNENKENNNNIINI